MIPTSKECRAALLAVFKTNETIGSDPHAARIHIDALVNFAMQRMNVSPGEWNKAADKIKSHIQRTAKEENGAFTISRGANGGVGLRKGVKL